MPPCGKIDCRPPGWQDRWRGVKDCFALMSQQLKNKNRIRNEKNKTKLA